MTNQYPEWTQEEINYLKENYQKISIQIMIKKLNRSLNSIYHKANKLKLIRGILWIPQEIIYLKNNYGKIKCSEMVKYLNRTWSAIVSKAHNLKLKSNRSFLIRGENNPFWNKHHTEEIKIKIGKKAKKRFEKIENRLIGIKNGMFQKHHSEEAKIKMKEFWKNPKNKQQIKAFCEKHGKTISGENNVSKRDDVRKKLSQKLSGKNNPAYIHGEGRFPYSSEFNKIFKELIRQRDGFLCLKCGMREEDSIKLFYRKLHIHHIDYDKKLTIKENCCCLCLRCNIEVNKNRIHWTKFFQSLLSEMYGYEYDEKGNIILHYQINKALERK